MSRYDRTPRSGSDRTNFYDEITCRIIDELETGRFPWAQPWGTAAAGAPRGLPQTASTGRAYLVGRWLVEKATARLRRDGRVAARFSLQISFLSGRSWARSVSCLPTQDTAIFLRLHRALWISMWRSTRTGAIISLGVNLTDVGLLDERRGDLLLPLGAAELTRGEQVSRAVDQINARLGDGAIKFGLNSPHPGFFERG